MLEIIFSLWILLGMIQLLFIAISVKKNKVRSDLSRLANRWDLNIALILVIFFCIGFLTVPVGIYLRYKEK